MRATRPFSALAVALASRAAAWPGLDARTIVGVHSPARTREELRRAAEMIRAGQ